MGRDVTDRRGVGFQWRGEGDVAADAEREILGSRCGSNRARGLAVDRRGRRRRVRGCTGRCRKRGIADNRWTQAARERRLLGRRRRARRPLLVNIVHWQIGGSREFDVLLCTMSRRAGLFGEVCNSLLLCLRGSVRLWGSDMRSCGNLGWVVGEADLRTTQDTLNILQFAGECVAKSDRVFGLWDFAGRRTRLDRRLGGLGRSTDHLGRRRLRFGWRTQSLYGWYTSKRRNLGKARGLNQRLGGIGSSEG